MSIPGTRLSRRVSPSSEAIIQGPRRWLGLIVVGLGVALIIVDSTIVNVAIPPVIRDLGLTSTEAQWVQEVYTLVFASLLLVWGRLADCYGRRLLFPLGTGTFAAASVLAALSQSGPELIGSRVAQGVGGAMMLPTSLSLLNAGFRGRDRGIAFAVWGSTIGAAGALTRQLSDALAQHLPLPAGHRDAIVDAVQQSAGAVIAGLAHDPRTALIAEYARDAFSEAARWTAFCAAAFLILGLLTTLSLGRGSSLRPEEGDPGEP
ncbi:MAG TPA: MFS transporter [Candidatus Dormibacteraeota bacterium]|nr:MFS transporter [Candidatus Dormibacteraeota bacterium]